jgi:LuxR family maltose regulon positive regulatory protein
MARTTPRTVTFLFTDIEGSTQLWEQHPQVMPQALARHDAIVRDCVEACGGQVFKTVGDSIHAAFATALEALAAALATQRALQAETWGATGRLRVRMALHTGVAELRDGDYFGPPLNRLARIIAASHGDQTLLSLATKELVRDQLPAGVTLRDLGAHMLKDLSLPEQIFQLVSPDLPADFPPLRTLDTPPTTQPAPPSALLATKLYIPPHRPHLVARPRLVERLQAGLAGKLTLIAAPAGFGKTTLLTSWIADYNQSNPNLKSAIYNLQSVKVAWVSLDAGDNDATRFWSYVITALETVYPAVGATGMTLLRSPQPPPIEVILTSLLNAINLISIAAALVLEDYHLIESPPIHAALAFALDHLPPQLHLLITTRVDPPLPLTRLRARGELMELRAADLRFTPDEAAAFLTEVMGLPLAAEQIAALEARTEGWIAGLQFAALAMRDRTDLTEFIAAFTGSNRFVMDYLTDEVLDRLPAHLQTFVLQTSILDRLCGPLCDSVLLGDIAPTQPGGNLSQSAYSQVLLEELDRINLFLVPLDDERRWYRYHHLFADVLRQRLASGATADMVATLHRRASAWFEAHRLDVEAISHALAAGAFDQAARLIEQLAQVLLERAEIATLRHWIALLPKETLGTRPLLRIKQAWALAFVNQLADALAVLDAVDRDMSVVTGPNGEPPSDLGATNTSEASWPDTPLLREVFGESTALRAVIAVAQEDPMRSVALCQQALARVPQHNLFVRGMVAMTLGDASRRIADGTVARQAYVEAAAIGEMAGNLLLVLLAQGSQAALDEVQGRLHEAANIYRQIIQRATQPGGELPFAAIGYIGLGKLFREWNDPGGAADHLVRAIALGQQAGIEGFTVDSSITLALVRMGEGDHASALALIQQAVDIVRRWNNADITLRLAAFEARVRLAQGQIASAIRWSHQAEPTVAGEFGERYEIEHLTIARVLLAQGRPEAAEQLLDQMLASARAAGRTSRVIESLALRALARHARADFTGALDDLQEALTLAEPEGYIRIFADEGAPMAALLRAAHTRSIAPEYVAQLLAAFARTEGRGLRTEWKDSADSALSPQSSALVEPLTDRELEVLRLIAAGRSNAEIAQALVVAVSTVKTHVNRIFGKLGATSRTQAVARAHELHLLEL